MGLFVGSVGKRKGVLALLDALHHLKLACKTARVVIAGGQEDEGKWQGLMRRNCLPTREVVGRKKKV